MAVISLMAASRGEKVLMRLPLQGRPLLASRGGWTIFLGITSAVLLLPLAGTVFHLFTPDGHAWGHLRSTVLGGQIRTTLILSAGVLAGTAFWGTVSAWIVTRYRFPGRRTLDLLLVLPLAMPTYISAYAWAGIFDFGGPVQRALVALGLPQASAVGVRITNLPGLIFVMIFSLAPYVHLIMRSAFRQDMTGQLEAAQSMGTGGFAQLRRTALPMARPALAAGLGIVLMDVLNEYGAVVYYGRHTLTTGIFRAWFNFYDLDSARRIGGFLLAAVFAVLYLEHLQRRRKRYYVTNSRRRETTALTTGAVRSAGLLLLASIPALLGFILPLAQLLSWGAGVVSGANLARTFDAAVNSILLTTSAVAVSIILSILIGYSRRILPRSILHQISGLSLTGHAIPGAIIALGVLSIAGVLDGLPGRGSGIVFSGSIGMLVYAYVIRFLAVAQRPISSALDEKFSRIDEASRSLGRSPLRTLATVHVPNLSMPVLAAASLAFLDIMKELPLTMILRPFNFQTLAVRAHELASNEQVNESSIPALLIILIGTVSILLLRAITVRKTTGPLPPHFDVPAPDTPAEFSGKASTGGITP